MLALQLTHVAHVSQPALHPSWPAFDPAGCCEGGRDCSPHARAWHLDRHWDHEEAGCSSRTSAICVKSKRIWSRRDGPSHRTRH